MSAAVNKEQVQQRPSRKRGNRPPITIEQGSGALASVQTPEILGGAPVVKIGKDSVPVGLLDKQIAVEAAWCDDLAEKQAKGIATSNRSQFECMVEFAEHYKLLKAEDLKTQCKLYLDRLQIHLYREHGVPEEYIKRDIKPDARFKRVLNSIRAMKSITKAFLDFMQADRDALFKTIGNKELTFQGKLLKAREFVEASPEFKEKADKRRTKKKSATEATKRVNAVKDAFANLTDDVERYLSIMAINDILKDEAESTELVKVVKFLNTIQGVVQKQSEQGLAKDLADAAEANKQQQQQAAA